MGERGGRGKEREGREGGRWEGGKEGDMEGKDIGEREEGGTHT